MPCGVLPRLRPVCGRPARHVMHLTSICHTDESEVLTVPEEVVAVAGRAVPTEVRLHAVEQVLAGTSVAEAAAGSGVSAASVRRWVRRW
ncbi:helix-turn-helix domain-containing protein, partial [Brevibacterium luteolum]|uniref:helix-turn-helix domain-containing protein n=1 Tax=Brevibacterium luteolum TaxID=199591 RepID=UPI0035CCD39A